VESNKLQGIRTQFATVVKQFQPELNVDRRSPNRGEIDDWEEDSPHGAQVESISTRTMLLEPAAPESIAVSSLQNSNKREIVKSSVRPLFDLDLFSEITAPISKLNVPKVNVDPWSAFWAILAATVGGTGITSYLLLIAVPPISNCQGISPLSTDRERLYCARVGAETKDLPKLRSAVGLVQGWTENHPLYREAQRLLETWSNDLLRIGRKQLNEGQIERAIATAKIVPPNSPLYGKAQESIAKWSAQSQNSASIDLKFEQSMKSGDWNQAFEILRSVQRMPGTYWNTHKHEKMSFKLAQERDGWDKLQLAKDALIDKEDDGYTVGAKRPDLVKSTTGKNSKDKHPVEEPLPTEPAPILKAMKLANQIDSKTYVYQEGQQLRTRWSKQLVSLSIAAYKAQSFNDAIAIAQTVPPDVSAYQEAQDWVKLNRAHVWAGKRHMLAMMDAIAQVKQIPKTSSIYTLAKNKQSNWRGMLKHQTQFQWAKTIASFQQPATLAIAIDTAKQIPAGVDVGDNLRGEINTWSRQIETIDNRVIFAKAQQIVNRGETLANLKAAVKLAGKIKKDRPMGEEIAPIVGEWTAKIQTVEDTPIIARAEAIAKKGNFTQAIEVANRIAPGRALYPAAQSLVRYCSLELQEIADRQTLDRAIAIYREGKIIKAIDLAATIGRRSPIYSDARSYVADWRLLLGNRAMRY
jgi:hypothetical protein